MNWLTNFVRPRIKKLLQPREAPDNLWLKCPNCKEMIFHRELEKALHVCTSCGHHIRLTAKQRLELLFDNKEWTEIQLPDVTIDPIKFKDLKKYSDRLKLAQERTGMRDAAIVAHGNMGKINVVVAVIDFSFLGGSMGAAVGEAIVSAAELAIVQESPLIVIPSSGGARMQEGVLSLMQMPRTTVAVNKLREKGYPYIVILTDPTTGGVTASFAMLGDIHIAEPGAVVGFAGARVIEQTIRETLPEGFQRSEYLLEHGMVDIVVHRSELKDKVVQLLSMIMQPDPAAPILPLNKNRKSKLFDSIKSSEHNSNSNIIDPSIPDKSLFETDINDNKN
ncbi:MAG: acetyl-CoA carboxylase, carboxyltransferase subunit beta [Pseudomonadota bacterium]|nr:acetyl-CoA carboxylase, carboxyltransferase subunit beta [Pseudomonadota bacterium]